MKSVSIIIPTISRKKELIDALQTIENGNLLPFEVIIVDQNERGFLGDLLESGKFSSLNIQHHNVTFKGASRARNYGIKMAKSEYCFFMDDDAELLPDTLKVAIETAENLNTSVVFGRCVDRGGKNSVIKFANESGYLSEYDYENKFIESTLLIKTDLIKQYLFDEGLGIGTFHGAEEAHDLVLRLMQDKHYPYFNIDVEVYHPNKIFSHDSAPEIKRVFSYRCGFGRLCRKHRLYKKYWSRVALVTLYIPLLSLTNKSKVRYYIAEILGLFAGWIID